LIGHFQAGRQPSSELALRPGPLPKFDGGTNGGISPIVQAPPGPPPGALQPQSSGSGPIRVPPLTPDKATQYSTLFEKSGTQNGVLPGEQAKQIFERAGLPNEILGKIWNLADTEQRGALTATEFVIAMHLLASFKAGALRALPNILPAGLYEAAARRPPSRQGSAAGSMSAIPRQFSGQPRTASPLSRPAYTAPQQFSQSTGFGNAWVITPADKQKFDGIFGGLDKMGKGFITGDEAVSFFGESKLPEEALAQIWDLADINSEGRLNKDEFAVAMYLIRQQRGKRDGRESLPSTLPPNLIPPSLRNQSRPTNLPTAPDFENPAPTMQKSAAEDLFGLDALSSPPVASAAPAQAPQSTGGSNSFGADPFRPPMTPTSPTTSSPHFKPFAPASSFGQTLTYNAPGGSSSSGPSQQRAFHPQPSASEDLLGDNDPEISKKLTNETTELANLSNQVGNLSKQMQEVQGQRMTSQNELTQASSQKREFETRLAQLRSLYEQEVKDVKSLDERLTASRNETKKLQTETAMIEGTYQDLQNQHQQTVTALQADQKENSNLKERMKVVNAEISQLKQALEKLRSDARQQKGLVAINKKQLATNEIEREKLKAEAEELNKSIEEDKKELAVAANTPSPAQVVSPALSTMSANNPFFRRQGSSSGDFQSSPFASPAPPAQPDRSFENVFGPAFGGGATTTESAPPTSFRQDSELQSALPTPAASLLARTVSGNGSDFSSPSASSPGLVNRDLPQASVPPPPPESRQLNSNFLPFPEQDESISSSRQVSAPNSRFGENSTGADTPTNYMGNTPTGSSVAGGISENTIAVSPGLDRISNASPATNDTSKGDSMPGTFPGDTSSHIVATPTGGSTLSEQAAADPFAINKEPVRTGTAKDDFDAAFAGFGSAAQTQERSNTGNSSNEGSTAIPPSGFNKEFPPIAELDDDDDDDDSDSASEANGFDDDFAPGSPGHTRNASSTQGASQPASATSNGDLLAARPGIAQNLSARSLATDPPTPGAQSSPPTYDATVTSSERAQSEVKEFAGLLPKRDYHTSPQASLSETMPGPSQSAANQTPFGAPQVTSQPVPPAKVPFDDFDEFDDLEDAKEGDADDDFANISSHDRSGLDDFNPMFDSPPAPPAKGNEQPASTSAAFGTNSGFGEFTQSPRQNTLVSQPATSPAVTNDNHDWDAIFAGLDTPTQGATATPPPAEAAKPLGDGSATSAAKSERPQIGRMLTEAGVHDDPILKNLTGMGYTRSDALAALEKYDYNLERVSSIATEFMRP
jgi:epidermal growth factor receptor substrate 15